jgi:hypothetical protein
MPDLSFYQFDKSFTEPYTAATSAAYLQKAASINRPLM